MAIYKSNGTYFAFIHNGSLFSRDGLYLGTVDGQYVWDSNGKFRGQIWNGKYVILNRFAVSPVPRDPHTPPPRPALPNPEPNIPAVILPTGWVDAF